MKQSNYENRNPRENPEHRRRGSGYHLGIDYDDASYAGLSTTTSRK